MGGANAAEDRTEAYKSLLTKRVSMVALLANPSSLRVYITKTPPELLRGGV